MEQIQTVRFTYDMSLADMVVAGQYGWKSDIFTAMNFPIEGSGEVAMPNLHHFGRFIGTESAVKELANLGLRPATLPELLLFGANQSEEQKRHSIVALDPERVFYFRGYRRASVLYWSHSTQSLDIGCWRCGGYGDAHKEWRENWLFAVVSV
jgi:hypothetical protein